MLNKVFDTIQHNTMQLQSHHEYYNSAVHDWKTALIYKKKKELICYHKTNIKKEMNQIQEQLIIFKVSNVDLACANFHFDLSTCTRGCGIKV